MLFVEQHMACIITAPFYNLLTVANKTG